MSASETALLLPVVGRAHPHGPSCQPFDHLFPLFFQSLILPPRPMEGRSWDREKTPERGSVWESRGGAVGQGKNA